MGESDPGVGMKPPGKSQRHLEPPQAANHQGNVFQVGKPAQPPAAGVGHLPAPLAAAAVGQKLFRGPFAGRRFCFRRSGPGSGTVNQAPLGIAHPAAGTSLKTAVRSGFAGPGPVSFPDQKFPADQAVNMVPGQSRPCRKAAADKLLEIDIGGRESLLPPGEIELVAPGVKGTAQLTGLEKHRPEPAVATAEGALQKTDPGIMPLEVEPPARGYPLQARPNQLLAAHGLRQPDLALPLERGMGLGHEGRDRNIETLTLAPGPLQGLSAQLNDALQVGIGLGRQADHEIELDEIPAPGKQRLDGCQDLVFVKPFVDDIPQPLGPGLGRDRKTSLAAFLQGLEHFPVQHPGPDRGQRQVETGTGRARSPEQIEQARMIADTQREKREFLHAGSPAPLPGPVQEPFDILFANRAVNHPGLAEAAAAAAAARDLERQAIVNHLDQRHRRPNRQRLEIEIGTDPAPDGA